MAEGGGRVLYVGDDREFFADLSVTFERADSDLSLTIETGGIDDLDDVESVDCVVCDGNVPRSGSETADGEPIGDGGDPPEGGSDETDSGDEPTGSDRRSGVGWRDYLDAVRGRRPDVPFLLVVDDDAAVPGDAISAGVSDVVRRGAATDRDLAIRVDGFVDTYRSLAAEREQVTWYEAVFEGMGDFVVVFGTDSAVKYVSPSIRNITGYTPEDVERMGPFGLVHPDDQPDVIEAFYEVMQEPSGATAKVETRAQHADGTWRIHEGLAANHLGEEPIDGMIVNVRDITDPARPKAFLDENLDRITDGFFALDTELQFTYVNDRASELLGHGDDDLVGTDLSAVLPADEPRASTFEDEFRMALSEGTTRSFEAYYPPSNVWAEVRVYPSETGLSVYVRDVTERWEREREREASQRLFRAAFESSHDSMVILDDEGVVVDANSAACDLYGLDRDSLVGTSLAEFAPEEFAFEATWKSFTAEDETRGTIPIVRSDGTRRMVEFVGAPNIASDRHLSTMRDVTERERREAELERYETIVQNVTDGVFTVDEEGTFTFVNRALVDLTGYDRDELLGAPVSLITDESTIEQGEYVARQVDTGERTVGLIEADARTAAGDTILTETQFAPLQDGQEYVGIVRDVTERRRQREQLEALNRLNDLIREINRALTRTTSRERLQQLVCDRLSASESYALAWIGERDLATGTVDPRAWANGDLDADDPTAELRALWGDDAAPAPTAAATGEIQVVQDLQTTDAAWADEAVRRGYRSVICIPFVYEGVQYGVLSVYATQAGAFDEDHRAILGQLREVVGHALNAIDRGEALLSHSVVEIELRSEEAANVFDGLADLDCEVTIERAIPTGDDYLLYVRTPQHDVEAFVDAIDRTDAIQTYRQVREHGDEVVFQLTARDVGLLADLASAGAFVRRATVADGELAVDVELSHAQDVRGIVEAIRRIHPDVELVSRQVTQRQRASLGEFQLPGEYGLTEQQRRVLETAYYSGFFEWPRDSTGEEVAGSIGIAPSTFHKHLRLGENKVMAAVFDDDPN